MHSELQVQSENNCNNLLNVSSVLPVIWVLHFVEEFIYTVPLLRFEDFVSMDIVAKVIVVPVPLHGNVAYCVANILATKTTQGYMS